MNILLEMPERLFLMMKVSVAQLILRKRMKVKVVNAGKCMLCGKEIKIHKNDIFPNILFCSECENKLKAESEVERKERMNK